MLTSNKITGLPDMAALATTPDRPAAELAAQVNQEWTAQAARRPADGWSWVIPLLADQPDDDIPEPVQPSVVEEFDAVTEPMEMVRAPEVVQLDEPIIPAPPRPKRRTGGMDRRRLAIGAGFVCLAAAVLAGGGWAAASLLSSGDEPTTNERINALSASPSAPPVADSCPDSVDGAVTTGDERGDQSSGAAAIKAWNYFYYVTRSARDAKSVTTSNAVATEAELQKVLDQIPAGTTHCLTITDRGHGRYGVVLTVTSPNRQPDVWKQLVQTVRADGRWWIASISKDGT